MGTRAHSPLLSSKKGAVRDSETQNILHCSMLIPQWSKTSHSPILEIVKLCIPICERAARFLHPCECHEVWRRAESNWGSLECLVVGRLAMDSIYISCAILYIHTITHTPNHTHTITHTHTDICIYIYIYTHTHTHICMCIYIYI